MHSSLSPVNPLTFIQRTIGKGLYVIFHFTAECMYLYHSDEHYTYTTKNCVLFVTINIHLFFDMNQIVSLSLMYHLGLVSYYQVLYIINNVY